MNKVVTPVSAKGQLVIPVAMRRVLGIKTGGRVALTLEDGVIHLRPVSGRLVDETCGMFSGGPSMAEELREERQADRW